MRLRSTLSGCDFFAPELVSGVQRHLRDSDSLTNSSSSKAVERREGLRIQTLQHLGQRFQAFERDRVRAVELDEVHTRAGFG